MATKTLIGYAALAGAAYLALRATGTIPRLLPLPDFLDPWPTGSPASAPQGTTVHTGTQAACITAPCNIPPTYARGTSTTSTRRAAVAIPAPSPGGSVARYGRGAAYLQ